MDKQLIRQEIFYFLTTLLGLFIVMEIIWPRIILAYFNVNWLLLAWVISAGSLLLKARK